MDLKEAANRLQEPFLPNEIEWRVDRGQKTQSGNFVFVLAYVTNRAIMNRLDEVFGAFGWRNEFKEWKGNSQLCGISVWDEEKKEWVTKWDGSDDSNMDAVKGGISGAMKRAAVQWGIGRYLYNLDQNRVPLQSRGDFYTNVKVKVSGKEEYINGYWNIPVLPDWALPEGYKKSPQKSVEALTEQHDFNPNESINEDLAAIERESQAQYGQRASADVSQINLITPGQVKMLYAKLHQSQYKGLPKEEYMELISAQIAKHVTEFKEIEKTDINKVIKWLDENKAA